MADVLAAICQHTQCLVRQKQGEKAGTFGGLPSGMENPFSEATSFLHSSLELFWREAASFKHNIATTPALSTPPMAPSLSISIPTTSTSAPATGKPFTLYHVTLQLPLRRHELRKRYSDFTALHTQLQSETGAAPPAPLPGKSWIRRTVGNEALTEERRKGLEAYLQSILGSEDARWRSSSAWRQFLNLPSGTTTTSTGGVGKARRRSSAGGIRDPNDWLDAHRELKSQIQSARQLLKQRESATVAKEQHALSADAKANLVRAAATITQLDDGLKSLSNASRGDDAGWGGSKKLGDGEIRRRKDLLGAARKEVEGLESVLKVMATRAATSYSQDSNSAGVGTTASSADKEGLWKGTAAAKPSGRVLGGPLKETERTRELENEGVLQLQQTIMKEQDEDVMVLGKTVAKLKDMGILMEEELTVQNEMLGLVEGDVDRVQGKLDVAKRRIGKIK